MLETHWETMSTVKAKKILLCDDGQVCADDVFAFNTGINVVSRVVQEFYNQYVNHMLSCLLSVYFNCILQQVFNIVCQ